MLAKKRNIALLEPYSMIVRNVGSANNRLSGTPCPADRTCKATLLRLACCRNCKSARVHGTNEGIMESLAISTSPVPQLALDTLRSKSTEVLRSQSARRRNSESPRSSGGNPSPRIEGCQHCKSMERKLDRLQAKVERIVRQPEYQAAILADVVKLERTASKAKVLEEKLKRRDAENKMLIESAATREQRLLKLQEDRVLVAPLQNEVRKHRKELTKLRNTLQDEMHMREESNNEVEKLKRELTHEKRVAEGVHWEPLLAGQIAEKDRELRDLRKMVHALEDEKRVVEEELRRSSEEVAHYRQKNRKLSEVSGQMDELAKKADADRQQAVDASRREASSMLKAVKEEAARAERARAKMALSLEKAREETLKAREEATKIANTYPKSAELQAFANKARSDADRAEAARVRAMKARDEAIAKAEQAEANILREAGKAGSEALRAEAARAAMHRAEEQRSAMALALGAAESALVRMRAEHKVEIANVRTECAQGVSALVAELAECKRALPAKASDHKSPQTDPPLDSKPDTPRVHVAAGGNRLILMDDKATSTEDDEAQAGLEAGSIASRTITGLSEAVKDLKSTSSRLESRITYLEKVLTMYGAESDLSTSIALPTLPDSTTPCKVRFELHGVRSRGGTRLWMGFVKGDGTALSYYRVGERQELNSFVGSGMLILRLSGSSGNPNDDQNKSNALVLPSDEIVCAFRPRKVGSHVVRVELADDGSVSVCTAIQELPDEQHKTGTYGWARIEKLRSLAPPKEVEEESPEAARAAKIDIKDAIARLRIRCGRSLPSESKLVTWREVNWGGRHLDDTDCAAIATLTSNGVFEKLVALKLDRNRIADGGVAAISKASQGGGFARLELLDLSDNLVSAEGVEAFSTACSDGSFARLRTLHLYGNRIGDQAMFSLTKALALGGPVGFLMSDIMSLSLHNNQIGDQGVKALARSVHAGALASCRDLYLHMNRIGDEGMHALAETLKQGAMASCRKLTSYSNPGNDTPVINVLKRRAEKAASHTNVA